MITSAAEYDFVDFANGDLPTANFSGAIMPLRSNPNILAAEDIAFLAECVRDKAGAFKGLTVVDETVTTGNTPGLFTPTRNISSSQMLSLRSFLAGELARGFPTSDSSRGYLAQSSMTEVAAYGKDGSMYPAPKVAALLAEMATDYGGTWAPTTTEAQFAVGARVLASPVAAMFDDAKHLVIPAFTHNLDRYIYQCHFEQTGGAGSPSLPWGYGWRMYGTTNDSMSYQGWLRVPDDGSVATLASVPDDYLADAHLWLVYGAYNLIIDENNTYTYSTAAGLVDMEANRLCVKTHADGAITWQHTALESTNLINRVISDCGWERKTLSSTWYEQMIYPLFSSAIVLVGTPTDRTKWWS